MHREVKNNCHNCSKIRDLRKEVKRLKELLLSACEYLDDGSAWADESEAFQEMIEACGYERA